jgi:hypothetical protein
MTETPPGRTGSAAGDPMTTTTTLPAIPADAGKAPSPSPSNWPPRSDAPASAPGRRRAPEAHAEPDTDEIRAALSPSSATASAPPPVAAAPAGPAATGVATAAATTPGPSAIPAGTSGKPTASRKPAVTRRAAGRGPRRAHLQLKHIDVWSVLKFSCVLAFALFFVWLIVIAVLFGVLDVTGVIDKINDTAQTLNDNSKDVVTPGLVLGGALVIGVINIVLFIVLSTIGSVVYNLCSDLVGGIEVTLSERD